jgi:hypothetical protein
MPNGNGDTIPNGNGNTMPNSNGNTIPNNKFPKEINMKITADYTCDDPLYPYPKISNNFPGKYCAKQDIDFNKSIETKDFCYIDSNISPELVTYYANNGIKKCSSKDVQKYNEKNTIKAKVNLTEDQRKFYDSKINEDKRNYHADLNIDKNQLMVDNKKIPININMSCNQGGRNTDEYGYSSYSGYGTPTLYNQCPTSVEGNYNNSLQGWYGDMFAGNNVYRRRNQWQDRDYYKEGYDQSNMSTLTNRAISNGLNNNVTKNNTVGVPFAPYTTYSPANVNSNYSDNARDLYNEN